MFKRYLVAAFLLAIGVFTLFQSTVSRAQQGQAPLTPQVLQLAGFGETAPASTFPAAGVDASSVDLELLEKHEVNELNTQRGRPSMPGPSFDGALDTASKTKSRAVAGVTLSDIWNKSVPSSNAPSSPTPSVLLTFEGLGVQNSAPPDTNAAVGPNDIVETVNTIVRVFDKSGNPRGPAFKQSSLYVGVPGVCATVDDGDPVVLYDRLADRWVITQFGFTSSTTPPYHECIAVSKTGDPMGAYYAYDFQLPGSEFPDYPHFGVWPDGYYWTTNQFLMGGSFDGAGVYAVDRKKMLVGDPTAGAVYFNLNLASHPEGIFGMLPSDHSGLLPPPASTPNVFIYFTNTQFGDPADGLRLFNLNFNTSNYALSTFVERSESTYATPLALAAFDARDPNGRGDIEQPPPAGNNSTDRLDSIGSRLMYPLHYINRNGTESIIGNFTVNVSGVDPSASAANYQAGFRYFELRRTSPGNLYAVNEQSTVFINNNGISGASGDNAWIASVGMDNQGNIAAGFSVSDVVSINPSLVFAGRAFDDPPNGFSFATFLFSGPGVQRGTGNRWGDYSSLSLDPVDDCTFWHANEYYTSNNLTFNWRTRIGAFKISSTCTPPAQGTLSGTITACNSGAPLSLAMVQVSNGTSTTTSASANGNYSMQLPPGDYTVTVTDPNRHCNSAGAFSVTITAGNTTTLNACLTGVAEPVVDPNDPTLEVITGGNGNGIIDANECNMLTVTAKNIGCAPATHVTAVLSTSTPNVTITQPNSPYLDMPIDASGTNTTPFQVSTSPSFVCGTPIAFTLTITFTGGSQVSNFSLPTCTETQPASSVSGSIDPTDSQTTQGRLGRNGTVSGCTPPAKTCPGLFGAPAGTGPKSYDTFNFVNGPAAACVTMTLKPGANGNNILGSTYLTSFDPTNLCTNYLGDAGGSSPAAAPTTPTRWSVNVPANATIVVVVMETPATHTASTPYSVTVSGLSAPFVDGGGICKFNPTLTTQASSTTHLGGQIFDRATISGGSSPTGTVTFRLFGPNQATCGGALVFMSTKTVSGNGTYTSDPFTPSTPGTYRWIANYSGDANNNPVAGSCNDANESVVVLPAATSVTGSGCINVPGGQATFILNASPGPRGRIIGNVDYSDPNAGFRLTQLKVTSMSFTGDCVHITGTAKIGKTRVSFTVDACDIAPPGTDSFAISISNGYSASGTLTCGDIVFN